MPVFSWLLSSRSHFVDEFLRSLITLLIPSNPQSSLTSETSQFIQDLIRLLQSHVGGKSRAGNGAILDCLPVLDPALVNVCPLKQRELLFGSTAGICEESCISQGLLLLVLLIHSGSWGHLQDTLDWLLSQTKEGTRVDPTAALQFVESCLNIPQLWQGRDTKSARGIETSFCSGHADGDILNLSTQQLNCLVMYILMEAEREAEKCDGDERRVQIDELYENRVCLLLRCSKGHEHNLRPVVEFLQSDTRWSKDLRQQFLIKLYLYLPELSSWVKDADSLVDLTCTSKAKYGKFDGFFHRMISILSDCQSGKTWEDRIDGVVLLCKKMAACHPAHILRYLPVIASLIRGRTHLTSKEFYNRNHFLFFTHILGLLDSLRPYIFDSITFIQDGLNDALDSFLDLVQSQCIKQKERTGVVAKLVEFLQHYLTNNPPGALRYLQTKVELLEDLLFDHSELSSLKSLLAVLSVPRAVNRANSAASSSTAGSSPDKIAPSPSLMMAPKTTPWTASQLETFLQRIGPSQPVNEVKKVLNDLDETSKRRVDILQFFLNDLVRLTKHVDEACRDMAHCLIARHLKQNPRDSKLIIDGYLECLSSSDPEIVMSAAKLLPEISILAAEYSEELLEKAFTASTQKLGKVAPYVAKTFQMFNLE